VSHNCHGRPINQAQFLEDNRTVYKLSVANSFGSRKEVGKLHKSWETWNTRELANEIAFLKYVRGSEKGRRTTKKKRTPSFEERSGDIGPSSSSSEAVTSGR